MGNVGAKLAGSLVRNQHDVTVLDLDSKKIQSFVDRGASAASSPLDLISKVDVLITCLPSPAASAAVAEGEDGFLEGMKAGQIWLQMSTTDSSEIARLSQLVEAKGGMFVY